MPPRQAPQEEDSNRLSTINLPARIKCSVCKKSKSSHQYSNKQLNGLRYKISRIGYSGSSIDSTIKCNTCTGSSRIEMKCTRCDGTKQLDNFSLAQRRKPEPICLSCWEDLEWTEADDRQMTTTETKNEGIVVDESALPRIPVWKTEKDGRFTSVHTSSTAAGTSSQHISDTDGGVKLAFSHRTWSSVGRSKQSNAGSSLLTSHNLNQLASLKLSNASYASNNYSDDDDDDVWRQDVNKSEAKTTTDDGTSRLSDTSSDLLKFSATGVQENDEANVSENHKNKGKGTAKGNTFTAFDSRGIPHAQMTYPSTDIGIDQPATVSGTGDYRLLRAPERNENARDTHKKFPSTRPVPRVRPMKLDTGVDEEAEVNKFRVAGMEGSDSDDDLDVW